MQSLPSRVRDAIETRGFLRPGERVGVAVSGGADSVALLLLLLELQKQLGVVLSVAHFNHKLRGKDADKDERFVAKLAAKYKLVFHSGQMDVGAKAKRDKANLEDTGRRGWRLCESRQFLYSLPFSRPCISQRAPLSS